MVGDTTLISFTYSFKRPAAVNLRTAFHSGFRKFRMGVDTFFDRSSASMAAGGEAGDEPLCAICHESLLRDATSSSADRTTTQQMRCGHTFHTGCLHQWVSKRQGQSNKPATCPVCHAPVRSMVRGVLRDKLTLQYRGGLQKDMAMVQVAETASPHGSRTLEHLKFEIRPTLIARL